jgi:L-ascorbate metabolism protein UlaG (beta-lactamase superfamily)
MRRAPEILVLSVAWGLLYGGCAKERPQDPNPHALEHQEEPKEVKTMEAKEQVGAPPTLHWFGHASFRVRHEETVIYIDPWKLAEEPHDASVVLVSHSHYDHYSPPDVAKVSTDRTQLLAPADVIRQAGSGQAITPGSTVTVGPVKVTAVPAYNPNKQFHPKDNQWVGLVVEVGSKRIYYAGDTDLTEEMKVLRDIDVALLPVGGTYTMGAQEAAEAARQIKPGLAIPYHWGDIVGQRADADTFAQLCQCEVRIVNAGETVALD